MKLQVPSSKSKAKADFYHGWTRTNTDIRRFGTDKDSEGLQKAAKGTESQTVDAVNNVKCGKRLQPGPQGAATDGIQELTTGDRILLGVAYPYLYSERLTNLFETCHNVIWSALLASGEIVQLLRLFRHSSFLWRLRGEEGQEVKYFRHLESIQPETAVGNTVEKVQTELDYFARGRSRFVIHAGVTPPTESERDYPRGKLSLPHEGLHANATMFGPDLASDTAQRTFAADYKRRFS